MDSTNRIAAGVPAGGQFAATNRPEAESKLPAEVKVAVTVEVSVPADTTPIPEWPDNLPEPDEIVWGVGDEDADSIWVSVYVGDETVTVWNGRYGRGSSVTDGEESTEWDRDTEDAVIEYAHAVRERVETNAYRVMYEAARLAEKQLLDAALGRTTR